MVESLILTFHLEEDYKLAIHVSIKDLNLFTVDKKKKQSSDSSGSLLATSHSGMHESHDSQPKSAKKVCQCKNSL